MRITNKMITNNASGNINGNKVLVDKTNTQMTTQKKIARPSENPVIAIRSLRLQTTLNKVNQYYEKNIPDAESWMDVTETALTNIKDLITNMRTLCVNGSTGTLTEDDRSTILTQLKALQSQVYAEGNADYAGRTVFTGYRTDKTLTFTSDDSKTSYNIEEPLKADAIYQKRYYTNEVEVPATPDAVMPMMSGLETKMDVKESDYNILRFAYDDIEKIHGFTFTKYDKTSDTNVDYKTNTFSDESYTDSEGNTVNFKKATLTVSDGATNSGYTAGNVYVFENEGDWKTHSVGNGAEKKTVGENDIVIIKETGEMVMGNTISSAFLTDDVSFKVDYTKTGFKNGELRPEYYFNCTQLTDSTGAGVGKYDPASMTPDSVYDGTNVGAGIEFERIKADGSTINYEIQYTVSQNQELTVNMEANEFMNHDIYQDMGDMIEIVNRSINAHKKIDELTAMKGADQYSGVKDQIEKLLEKAQKEADYADDNMQKRYSELLGNVDSYLEDVNLAITKMGCRGDQLSITKTRMNNQQETVEELQSTNDDMDLSDIIIKYTAAYTAYQSSLTAAGKLSQQTLLNYI